MTGWPWMWIATDPELCWRLYAMAHLGEGEARAMAMRVVVRYRQLFG